MFFEYSPPICPPNTPFFVLWVPVSPECAPQKWISLLFAWLIYVICIALRMLSKIVGSSRDLG